MTPFFIVGAPRSGTTMLRDMLKDIPDLYSPEETHFYRWAAPFGGPEFTSNYKNNQVLKLHREMDGVDDKTFFELYSLSKTRGDFSKRYSEEVCRVKGKKYWFDKTPQNIYSLPLLAAQFSGSQVIHIYRNPYAVIKSLMVGKVIHVPEVVGATNYWLEAMQVIDVTQHYLKERLTEICYENLVSGQKGEISKLESSLGLDMSSVDLSHMSMRDVDYTTQFTRDELDVIRDVCGQYMKKYGYEIL